MSRNTDLILLILRYAEEDTTGRALREPSFDGYGLAQVRHHIDLCQQQGLLKVSRSGKRRKIVALTSKGHDHLDDHRDG